LQRHQALAAAEDDLAQRHLTGLGQIGADHAVGFLRHRAVGHDEVGLLEVERVDLVRIDKLDEIDGVLGFHTDRLQLRGLDRHVTALSDLVALDDLVAVDRTDPGHDLLVAHPCTRRTVNLMERDPPAVAGGAVELDREGDEGKPDVPLPVGAWCHAR
jgi:hypothetical protein